MKWSGEPGDIVSVPADVYKSGCIQVCSVCVVCVVCGLCGVCVVYVWDVKWSESLEILSLYKSGCI